MKNTIFCLYSIVLCFILLISIKKAWHSISCKKWVSLTSCKTELRLTVLIHISLMHFLSPHKQPSVRWIAGHTDSAIILLAGAIRNKIKKQQQSQVNTVSVTGGEATLLCTSTQPRPTVARNSVTFTEHRCINRPGGGRLWNVRSLKVSSVMSWVLQHKHRFSALTKVIKTIAETDNTTTDLKGVYVTVSHGGREGLEKTQKRPRTYTHPSPYCTIKNTYLLLYSTI